MCSRQYDISIIGINKAITYWAIYQFATQRYTTSEDIVAWYQLSWVQSLNQMYGKHNLTHDNSLISNRGNESWQLICHQWSVELSHRWLPEVNIHLIAHWMLVVCLWMWVVWPGCQCVTLSLSRLTGPTKNTFCEKHSHICVWCNHGSMVGSNYTNYIRNMRRVAFLPDILSLS